MKITDIINPKLIPDERERYKLYNHQYGYQIDIYNKNLIFIPNIVKKEFKIHTPFSDAQRLAMEKFIIKEWKDRKTSKTEILDNWIPSYEVQCYLCKECFADDNVFPYNKHYYCSECYREIRGKER